jgi:hypothetical protein
MAHSNNRVRHFFSITKYKEILIRALADRMLISETKQKVDSMLTSLQKALYTVCL